MGICVHDTLTILSSIVLITGVGWGEAIWLFYKHENDIHFDNEQNIDRSFVNYEESGYNVNLDLLSILVLIVSFISYEENWVSWKK